jgi:hypothetical protein
MSNFAGFVKGLGKDFYQEAKATKGPNGERVTEIEFFAHKAEAAGYEPDKGDIERRTAEMCKRCNIQPHELRRMEKARQLVHDTAPMWEVFDDAGIDPFGEWAPTVAEVKNIHGKAFGTSSVQNVFPVLYQSQIMEGILATPMIDDVVAFTVQTNGMSADHVGMTDTAAQRRLAESGEWARGVELAMSYTNAQIALKKFQGTLKASGEALRAARIPVFAAALRRVGQQLGIDMFDFALDVLVAGDGTTLGPAATTVAADVSGTPDYGDFVDILLSFTDGYTPTDFLAHSNVLANIFNIAEFKDHQAGFNFQRTGAYPTPLGWTPHRWDSLGASNYAATKLVVWQRNLALVQYNWGGVEQENDRIIENDYQANVVRLWTGFGIWDRAAVRVGTGFAA